MFVLTGVAIAVALAFVRPYSRASAVLRDALEDAMPPGTGIENVRVSFPTRVAIGRIEFPADPERGLPPLTVRDIDGTTPWRSWLRGRPTFLLNTRVWGGAVHVTATPADALRAMEPGAARWQVDAEVREVRLEECLEWLQLEGPWRGRIDLSTTADVHTHYPRASQAEGSIAGQDLYIPPLEFDDVILPANARALLHGRATYRDEFLEVTEFSLRGTGYVLEATARVQVREPFDSSPLRGNVALQLKEAATWRRRDVDPALSGAMVELFVQSKGRVHVKLRGTVGEPEAALDEAGIVRELLERSR